MEDVTVRQKELLKIIVNEYIDSALPVGSETLVEKHKLKYSPATIRNEMAALKRKGFLQMPHTSAGRVPTNLGLRFYISELMEEQEIPVLQEVSMRQRVWQERYENQHLLRNIALALADSTKYLSIVSLNDGFLIHAGSVNILDYPEFFDIEVAKTVLNLLDNYDLFEKVISKGLGTTDIKVLIGSELSFENLGGCGIVFTNFDTRGKSGVLGVIGPNRMSYSKVIPVVRYMRNLVHELTRSF